LTYVIISSVSQSILAGIRNSLFDRLTRLDLSFSQRTRAGEVATIFLRDVDQLNEAIFDVLDRAVMHPVRLAAVTIIMLSQSWILTLWMVVFLGAGAVVVRISGSMIERLCTSTLRQVTQLQGSLVEYLSSVILARLFNREDFERRRFGGISDSIRRGIGRIVFLRNLAPESVNFLFALAAGGILILGGHQVFVSKALSAGTLVKLLMLLTVAAASVEKLAVMYANARVSLASARRVFGLLDLPLPPPDLPDAIEAGPFSRQIELHGVEYQADGHTILESINLHIEKGQRVLVFGPSGAGKSTLLGLIAGVLRCSRGRIEVDGVELGHVRSDSWRRKLGVVLQDAILLSGTVRDNLLYACPNASENDLRRVLVKVRLDPDQPAPTSWLDRQVGSRGENLSGGERQRVAIARALLNDPEILLLDEPTSMLDAASKQQVFDTIRAASEGRTLILVTHDPFLHKLADLEVHLRDGQIVAPPRQNSLGNSKPAGMPAEERAG
jgi:ABC-type multidrug transport system fused ATPase/permease subunit